MIEQRDEEVLRCRDLATGTMASGGALSAPMTEVSASTTGDAGDLHIYRLDVARKDVQGSRICAELHEDRRGDV